MIGAAARRVATDGFKGWMFKGCMHQTHTIGDASYRSARAAVVNETAFYMRKSKCHW